MMRIGQMLYQWMTKLDWFSTLFPRIPVPIQKQIERRIEDYCRTYNVNLANPYPAAVVEVERERPRYSEHPPRDDRNRDYQERSANRDRDRNERSQRSPEQRSERRKHRSRSRSRDRSDRHK